MERREEKQLGTDPALRKEQEQTKDLTLEALNMPIDKLLKMYKRREIPIGIVRLAEYNTAYR